MRTEEIKRIILKIVYSRKSETYGYEIHKRLASESVKIEQSRLYRVLNGMLREGLLKSSWVESKLGPKKRVYRLGDKGKRMLDEILMEAIETVHSFYEEYVRNLPPNADVFDNIWRPLTEELNKESNIAYITPRYSHMNKRMIQTLQNLAPKRNIYFVKPGAAPTDLKLDNLTFLNGIYDNVPLKNSYVDLLMVIGLPQKDFLETALREWHRVLKQDGSLAILAPTVLIHKFSDPLPIGAFIEKFEHEAKKEEYIDRGLLDGLMKKSFRKIEEKRIVHMTILTLSEPRLLRI